MCLFNVEDPEGSAMHIWAHYDITAGMQCCTALVWLSFPLGILPSLPPPVSLLVPALPGLSLLASSFSRPSLLTRHRRPAEGDMSSEHPNTNGAFMTRATFSHGSNSRPVLRIYGVISAILIVQDFHLVPLSD